MKTLERATARWPATRNLDLGRGVLSSARECKIGGNAIAQEYAPFLCCFFRKALGMRLERVAMKTSKDKMKDAQWRRLFED